MGRYFSMQFPHLWAQNMSKGEIKIQIAKFFRREEERLQQELEEKRWKEYLLKNNKKQEILLKEWQPNPVELSDKEIEELSQVCINTTGNIHCLIIQHLKGKERQKKPKMIGNKS
jgi:hypothetical protein